MTDIAVLGISTQIDGVQEADQALDNLAGAAKQAEQATESLGAAQAAMAAPTAAATAGNARLSASEQAVATAANLETAALARTTAAAQANAASTTAAAAANDNFSAAARRGVAGARALSTAFGFGIGTVAIGAVTFLADQLFELATQASATEIALAALEEQTERNNDTLQGTFENAALIDLRRIGEDAGFAADPTNRFATALGEVSLALQDVATQSFLQQTLEITQSINKTQTAIDEAIARRDDFIRDEARGQLIQSSSGGLGVNLGDIDAQQRIAGADPLELAASLSIDTGEFNREIGIASAQLAGLERRFDSFSNVLTAEQAAGITEALSGGDLVSAAVSSAPH